MELKDTVDGMLSTDYKERFIAEYRQLTIRLDKLHKMLSDWDNGGLNFEPSCPRVALDAQMYSMKLYKDALRSRAEIEGITL